MDLQGSVNCRNDIHDYVFTEEIFHEENFLAKFPENLSRKFLDYAILSVHVMSFVLLDCCTVGFKKLKDEVTLI